MIRVLKLASVVLCISLMASAQPVWAESNIWHKLIRTVGFAAITRAQLEFDCRETPQFISNSRLKNLCAKRNQIPDYIIEDAALPYLRKHVSEYLAGQAINALQAENQKALSNKLLQVTASGKTNLLTKADIDLLEKRNATDYSQALSAFATDKERSIVVAQAMFDYIEKH